jgi:predicted nucleic acid-binding protein
MAHESAPHVVREYLLHSPGWMIIRTPRAQDASLRRLGAGEIEAISLAQELRADLLLVDDKEARKAAEARGLTCTGTLGVLKRAAELGLIDYDQILEALRGTSMRFPPEKGQ